MKTTGTGLVLALAAAAAVLYLPTLSYDFMAWDDHAYVAGNPLIRFHGAGSLGALFSTYYRANYAPLHLLAYSAIYGAAGAAPWAFHALNVLLHALCTGLVFLFLRRVALPAPAAALGAALFLAHPAQVEVVAWVSQAKTLLATAFGMGALLLLLGYRERREAGGGGVWYAAAVFLFLGAVLSKPQAIAFPGIYICVDRALGDRARRLPLRYWIPLALIAVAGAWVGVLAQNSIAAVKPYGPLGPLGSFLGSAGIALAYLRTTLIPVNLSVLHAGAPLESLRDPQLARDVLLFCALAVAAWRLRGGALRPWHALGAFLAPLVPVLGWVPLNVSMADRYLYPAMIAFAWIAAGAAARLDGWGRRALWLLPLCMALLAAQRMPMWRNGASLWDAEIRKHPDSFHAWTSRSGYRYRNGDPAGAEEDLRRALALNGKDAGAWTNLGVILNAVGRTEEATAAWRQALAIDPEAAMPRLTLGWERARRGDMAGARALIDSVIRDRPRFAMAYVVRAAARGTGGDSAGAEADLSEAARLSPFMADVHESLGKLREARGDLPGARASYGRFLRLWTGDAARAEAVRARLRRMEHADGG